MILGRGNELRIGAPRRPVAQIAVDARASSAIIANVPKVFAQARDFGFDRRQTFGGDEIRRRRDRPIGQVFDGVVIFFDKGAAHAF